jgi:L-threonylcarbamoyladenylate synthase
LETIIVKDIPEDINGKNSSNALTEDKANLFFLAAKAIIDNELVAFPTETVYGLGANALNANAVKKIFEVKGRPGDNPLIVHVADKSMINPLVTEITETARSLIDAFMPGPITLVFRKSPVIPYEVTAGLETVAIRIPSHDIALKFLQLVNLPVAAPSANLSGKPSPTSAKHVYNDLSGKIGYIIDGGYCDVGVESTVVDVTGDFPVILRPGLITAQDIFSVCGKVKGAGSEQITGVSDSSSDFDESKTPPSPGMKYRHYAPVAQIFLTEDAGIETQIIKAKDSISEALNSGKKVGVYGGEDFNNAISKEFPDLFYISYGSEQDVKSALIKLFYALRKMDEKNVDLIIVETFKADGVGVAYMNRLIKAARIC